ncbi:type II toxin-antitoxin system RelB family antitoxin [Roseitalea porphyridii]|uniref:Ribbon-helix-helix protein, CopG family n=1 Tax=Roseitalea porphyridii TaxID=1852022 RepID=A0A4P6UX10_9HYPH|nr:DUF6290 family protein [Roseitalea porphyridii]QBK29355.1 ribbon-helix-helix protein, CopG family [Roseitalea porphyridii]
MKSVSVRIDDDIKARWERLSDEHGLNASHLMRQAIVEKLEELEDFYTVRQRLSEPFDPVPDEDVWKRAGLAD